VVGLPKLVGIDVEEVIGRVVLIGV